MTNASGRGPGRRSLAAPVHDHRSTSLWGGHRVTGVRAMSAERAGAAIRHPDRNRLDGVAEVFAQSHAEYPAFVFTFPDPSQRREALRLFFRAVARDAARFDSVFVAESPDGALHGAAIWLPPGTFPWSPPRQARAAFDFLGVLAAAPRSFRTFMGTGQNAARLHPSGRHWYLEALGVVPTAQGGGLGGRLISPILELADEEGVDCYLETSDRTNVPFYERRGFKVEEAELALVPGGPRHCSMRRRPMAR